MGRSYYFREFVRLRKEVSRVFLKRNAPQRIIITKIEEQTSILTSLSRMDLQKTKRRESPRKSVRTPKRTPKKHYFVMGYLISCAILDVLMSPLVGTYILAVVGVEATILFGLPRLLEWMKR